VAVAAVHKPFTGVGSMFPGSFAVHADGADDIHTLSAMGILADVYRHAGDLPSARKIQQDALPGLRTCRSAGPKHEQTIMMMQELAQTDDVQQP
jgi:hypothetical protein